MNTDLILSAIIVVIFFGLFMAMLYLTNKYGRFRKKAFSSMGKVRLVLYFVPLILAAVLVAFLYFRKLTGYLFVGASIEIVLTGIVAGVVLFDVIESRRVKLSGAR
jgi:hypothetical protein